MIDFASVRIWQRLVDSQRVCRPLLPVEVYTVGIQALRNRLFRVGRTWGRFSPRVQPQDVL